MKRLFFVLFLAVVAFSATAQRLEPVLPPASQLAKEYRPTYRRLVQADEQRRATLERQGFDIILPAEEQVPTLISDANTLNQTNWGRDALSAGIAERLATECIYPVIVKVTDTGGKLSHSDLQVGQLTGSTYTGEATIDDVNGHATHCAGIIAAQGLGLAWPLVASGKVKFKPVKFLSDGGGGSFTWVQNGFAVERAEDIAYRQQQTAVVYSDSWGGGTAIIQPVEDEITKSIAAGVYMFFANGNTGGPVNYPAMSPLALSIASLDQSMIASSYSSRGPETDIAMPGRNINSTFKGGTYAVLSGTSMATPFAAAAGAIALSKWGMSKLPNQAALTAYLTKIATDIPPAGRDDATGSGVVFVQKILDTAPDGGTPPPPPPPPPVDPPVAEKITVSTTFGNVAMRYAFAGETMLRNLNIIELTLSAEGATAEEAHAAINQTADKFFASSYIAEIPLTGKASEIGLYGATYWTGTFLNYAGRPNKLRVVRIIAKAEGALALPVVLDGVFNRFTDDATPDSYEMTSVQPSLRSIKQ
jgi:subtilisin family serine protease